MDHPHHHHRPNSSRAEAERWLVIADKLLTSGDLIGSKTFALRARESDPTLHYADAILAVADTLLAAQQQHHHHPDWYAVLQLPAHTHDAQLIAAHYHRLALLLNPNRNTIAFADQAFNLVSEAWSVLSNPSRKSIYDNELNLSLNLDPMVQIGSSRAQHHHHQHQQHQEYNKVNYEQSFWKNPRNANVSDNDRFIQQQPPIWQSPRGSTINDTDQVNQTVRPIPRSVNLNVNEQVYQQQPPIWTSPSISTINDTDQVNQTIRPIPRSVNLNVNEQVYQQQPPIWRSPSSSTINGTDQVNQTVRPSPRSVNLNDNDQVILQQPPIWKIPRSSTINDADQVNQTVRPIPRSSTINDADQVNQTVRSIPRNSTINDTDQVSPTVGPSARSVNLNDKGQVHQQPPPIWKSPRSSTINDTDKVNQTVRPSSTSAYVNDKDQVNQQQPPIWKSPTSSTINDTDRVNQTVRPSPRSLNLNDKDQVNQQQPPIWKNPWSSTINDTDQVNQTVRPSPTIVNMNDEDQVNQQPPPIWKSPGRSTINDTDQVNHTVEQSPKSVNLNDKDQVNQQQQQTVRQNPRIGIVSEKERVMTEDSGNGSHNGDVDDGVSSFWTACPYCFNMYEYPRVFKDCTLRCQNCRSAFHGLVVPSPPILEGKEAYFCCWSFFPLGFSKSNLEKGKGVVGNWTPFSPLFTCPQVFPRQNMVDGNVDVVERMNVTPPRPKKVDSRKSSTPRIYIEDDQDVYAELSESSDDSDDEWGSARRKKKKARNVKGKDLSVKSVKTPQVVKGKNVRGGSGENSKGGAVVQEDLGVSNISYTSTSKKAVLSKKQTSTVAKESGKLDLNVKFSNEVEDPTLGMSEGHAAGTGEEDGIEGNGFFEGLDEFLNTLPILSVVGDNKVKAT